MDIKEIRRLVELMVGNDLTELDISEGENKIHLKRGGPAGAFALVPAPAMQAPAAPAHAPAAPAAPVEKAGEKLIEIRSPMVGTFYSAPSPDSDPFVTNGTPVSDETTVCIVEAMKVMNEIKAECSGTIVEVCVKNAQPVEYNQVLYRVRPS